MSVANKIGKPINEAIYELPNMVNWIEKNDMPKANGTVHESPALDGVGIWVENKVKPIESEKSESELREEIIKVLKEKGVEVIVSYLPVGSEKATQFWAQVCWIQTLHLLIACLHSLHQIKSGHKTLQIKTFQSLVTILKVRLEQQ